MSALQKLVGGLLPDRRITIVWPDGKRELAGGGTGDSAITVRLTDRKLVWEILRKPSLGLGEGYMDGRLQFEGGTILDFLRLIARSNPWEGGGQGRRIMLRGKIGPLLRKLRRNPADKAKRNVAHHYDLDDRLYALFLDTDRQYSCAYFRDPDHSLEQAQADKKAHIAAKLHLKPGQRVLDIGCGWGGTALYLNRIADVDVLGITLSEEQLAVARRRAAEAGVADRVKFELIDYRQVTGRFDRIVSVGMFEHVGAAHYREFFARCREMLTDDGVMLLHTIGKYGEATGPDPFTDKWIFPGYHVPSLSQIAEASESARLITADVETLRLHYAYTLLHWLANCEEHRAEIEALYDERFFRMWEYYLAGGIVAFENGAMNNFQLQYVRDRRALPITRDYMTQVEERYRALASSGS
ncbi:class I SAM-dependent methyltransferase [Sphingomonas sp. GCM10030256]|uniref:class I SAM-dependent methyltransferase n=1 Tax=Sphingomonas sp. GCM10030256 TaxID=3273427 RepID=UPI003607DC69